MIDLNEISVQLQQYRDAVQKSRSPRTTSKQLATVIDSVLEELSITIEELEIQNEELNISSHLQNAEIKRYHEMFAQSPLAYIVTDQMGVIREANNAAGRLLNVEMPMLIGKPLSVYIDQDHRRTFRRLLQNIAVDDMRHVVDVAVQPRGRATVATEVSVRATTVALGELAMLNWVFRDVTDRDRKLRAITATNAMLQERLDEEVARLNKVASERDAAVARESTAHWLAESASRRLAFLAEASETMTEVEDAGRALSLLLSCVVPSLADWGVVALVNDDDQLVESLTAHENSEQDHALKDSIGSESFQPGSLLICAHDVLATGMPHSLAKGDERPGHANDRAARSLFTAENANSFSILSIPLRSCGRTIGVLELGRGRTWAPFDSDDLSYALIAAGRSSAAFDAARMSGRVRVANAVRDQFLAIAAHELRTPITVFRGYAQILSRLLTRPDDFDRARARRMAVAIEQQADRLSALVEQLVDVSRLESCQLAVQLEEIDLSSLVSNLIETAQATTDLHRIDGYVEPDVVGMVDGVRFEQVVAHLLDNAVKFSLRGGMIYVRLERPSDALVRLTVADQGIGLKAEHRDRIFDPFFLAHERTDIRGIGLGLFINREIMRLHGGDLRVEFPSGVSTCFVAEFPLLSHEDAPVTD